MGVTFRVLEDLAAFDAAISHRFKFRTIALFATPEGASSSHFVRDSFGLIDWFTGPQILAVTLEEPRGGYWRYLHGRSEPPHGSVHSLLTELNRAARNKADISRDEFLKLGPIPTKPAPSNDKLNGLLRSMNLPGEAPFLLLFAIPQGTRNMWSAEAYAMVQLTERSFADSNAAAALIERTFDAIKTAHGISSVRQRASVLRDRLPASTDPRVYEISEPVSFGQFVAFYTATPKEEKKVVITLHGINTYGTWQKQIDPWIALQGWIPWPFDYAKWPRTVMDATLFLLGHTPEYLMQNFRNAYQDIAVHKLASAYIDHVVVIAHSFGTKVVADTLQRYQHLLKFEKFIFCGCIVNGDFDWRAHLSAGRIGGVLNEFGSHDVWTRTYAAIRRTSVAGTAPGFKNPPSQVVNLRREVTHSDWFNELQFERVWAPYLKTGAAPPASA